MKKLYLSLFAFLVLLPQITITFDSGEMKTEDEQITDLQQEMLIQKSISVYNLIINLRDENRFNNVLNQMIQMIKRKKDKVMTMENISNEKLNLMIVELQCEADAIGRVIDLNQDKFGYSTRIQRLQDVINATNELINTIQEKMISIEENKE